MKLSAACAFIVGTVALDIGSTISTTEATVQMFGEEDKDTAALNAVVKSTKKPKNNGAHHTPAATTTASNALGV